ncbi:MAG TPA: ADOP family duplicated permease [Luteitalea sp.]|nr:ADOP family duplicated permease [Luteitalea sp.]
MASPRRRNLHERLYALLLRTAYPLHFRSRFGAAMAEDFDDEYEAAQARGRVAVVVLWLATVVQAVWFGTIERVGGPERSRVAPSIWVRDAACDVRYAVRLLRWSPIFAVSSIVSLSIGLAAFSTIVAIADALFVQAGPGVRQGHRLVDIARSTHGVGDSPLTFTIFDALRRQSTTVTMAAATRNAAPLSFAADDDVSRVYGRPVSANYFDVLQVRPALGRFFSDDEDRPLSPRPVVVVSHDFWRRTLNGDPRVLDRPYRLNGTPVDIIGVAEPRFEGTTLLGTDLWVPMAFAAVLKGGPLTAASLNEDWGWHDARGIGRLRGRASREVAQAELSALMTALRAIDQTIPAAHTVTVDEGGRLPPRARPLFAKFVALITVLAAGLLAVACTNVAGMLLARATTRRHEIAMRLSLGASRWRLVRQLLLETVTLFTVAGVVSLPLVWWLTATLPRLLPANLPIPMTIDVALSYRTLLVGIVVVAGSGFLFGLAPARHALAADLSPMFAGRAATEARARLRLRNGLVVAQVALSLAMAITAGLLVRTLHAAALVDIGFQLQDVTLVSLDTSMLERDGAASPTLVAQIDEQLRTIGGVRAVGHGRTVPLRGDSTSLGAVRTASAQSGGDAMAMVDWDIVSPDFFEAVGLPIRAGRAFASVDRQGSPDVAIVNETFARRAWPDGQTVGRQLWHTDAATGIERILTVVGVVHDARYRYVSEPARPMVYRPFAQAPDARVHFYLSTMPGRQVAAEVRQAIARVEPRLPVVRIESFEDAALLSLLPQRFAAAAAGAVGGLGALLAALGLYGVIAFVVAQRTREIAVRIALGASRRSVRTLVLRQAAWLGVAGAAGGTLLAWVMGRLVQQVGLLIGTSPSDPLTFGVLVVGMAVVVLVASDVPARRAARTDPAAALRSQ